MKRNFTLPLLALLAGMMLLLATNSASAQQNPNCCTYTVILQGLTGACSVQPIPLTLRWDCPPVVTTTTNYTGNGTHIEPIGNSPLSPCPPACKLIGLSLDGINFIPVGVDKSFHVGNCCYMVASGFDVNGCAVIKIFPC